MASGGGAVAKRLQPACRLAITVAAEGEAADPKIPAPPELRPILGFSRLSAAAYAVIQRAIDDDGIFRARVAEQADPDTLGRAGWLWLTRPVDWAEDEAFRGSSVVADPPPKPPKATKDVLARARKEAAAAEAARRKAVEQLAAANKREAEQRKARADAEAAVAALEAERSAAMRAAKALEADLAAARRDLKVAREATRQAEAELLAARSNPVEQDGPAAARRSAELRQAAADAADLAAALAALVPAAEPERSQPHQPKRRAKKATRSAPALPPGVFDGTPEAHRHLIGASENLLVVDGYNLARAAWTGLAPEEERRRTVALLDDVQARSGATVIVVFDGDDAVTAPKASKNVRVRFSATGQTADDAITDLVGGLAAGQCVVVVSSDRAVMADARRLGAVAVGSKAFLAAAGR